MTDAHPQWEVEVLESYDRAHHEDLAEAREALAKMGNVVDLDDPRISRLLEWEGSALLIRVESLIETLGNEGVEEGFGVFWRLLAGLQSVAARRDGNVTWASSREGSRLTVKADSEGGCWSKRRWALKGLVEVRVDDYMEVLTSPTEPGRLTVWSAHVPTDSDVEREETVYVGDVIAQFAAQQWAANKGRCALRGE
jgi:hypothetical protein